MFYQVYTKCKQGAELPYDAKEGDDRLSYISPTPEVYEKTADMIYRGILPRYFGPEDGAKDRGEYSESIITFPTQEAANEWADFVRNRGDGIGSESSKLLEVRVYEVPEFPIKT